MNDLIKDIKEKNETISVDKNYDGDYSIRFKTNKSHIVDAKRYKTAKLAIGSIEKDITVFGLTKGQFSFLDIVEHILSEINGGDVTIATWAASKSHIKDCSALINSGLMKSLKLIVDYTMQNRQPELMARIRDEFGYGSIRVTNLHAKFALIKNKDFNIVVNTSMNLNNNPRIEDFEVAENSPKFYFLNNVCDVIFKKDQSKSPTYQENLEFFKNV